MDLHRLGLVSSRTHNFALVARLGSIRAAAKSLNVAPSSISRLIKLLEADLGTPLFERRQQRIRLTSAGELLYYHIRQSSRELSRAVTEIHDLKGLRRGRVSIGVVESVARGLMAKVLSEFWTRNREISVDIHIGGSAEVTGLVAQGEIDLAVAFDSRVPRNVRRVTSTSVPMGVAVKPGSKIALMKGPIRPFDLADERVILSDASLALGPSVEDVFIGSFVELSRRARTNSISVMIELATRGLGAILQTRLGIEREIASGELVFLPLSDAKLAPRRLHLFARPKPELSEAAEALCAALALEIERLSSEK
jgi:DNA-binding transcriptional LysR family regulator